MKEETKQMIKQALKEWSVIVFLFIPVEFIIYVIIANNVFSDYYSWYTAPSSWFAILSCLFTISLFFPKVRVPVCKPILKFFGFLFNAFKKNVNYIFVVIMILGLLIWCLGDIIEIADEANNAAQASLYTGVIIAKLLTALFITKCWTIIRK